MKGCFFMENKFHKDKYAPDYLLLTTIVILLIVGLLLVYSSSHIWAEYKYDDSIFFLKRQLLFVGAGLVGMYIFMKIPYHFWSKHALWILLACFTLLLLVLVPGVGIVRGGARSWIGIGAFSIQPSEFVKLGLIIFIARMLARYPKNITKLKKGFLPLTGLIFMSFGLIMLQPDLGTGVVLVTTCMVMMYVAGARISHFMTLAMIGVIGFVGLILSAPYRLQRVTSFLNPWEDPLGDGFQIIQSLFAIGPGGLFGVGYGNSLQKYFYLPEPQTDFIFSILGEEFGFIGGIVMLSLFFILFWRGCRVAMYAPDEFGKNVALGITAMLTIQVMINISVVIGLIPVTGITLPFLSYGGSSLTLALCSVGVLLNISRYARI